MEVRPESRKSRENWRLLLAGTYSGTYSGLGYSGLGPAKDYA
jgi:hypothetical protein